MKTDEGYRRFYQTETVNDAGFWNDVVVGLLALVIGAYSAYKARDQRRDARRTAT
jgi:hypothetical protein